MTTPFLELAKLVKAQFGTSEDALLEALFVLRAHYDLGAIVLCCQRLDELLELFPSLAAEPAFEDQPQRLEVLRQVARLNAAGDHFVRGNAGHDVNTPLRPFTGDSGLCDLLRIAPEVGVDPAHARDYACLQAWYAWQVFHHQGKRHTLVNYKRYLLGSGKARLNQHAGTRVYGGFLALRRLADRRARANAHAVVALLQPATEARSRQLVSLLQLAMARQVAGLTRRAYLRTYGVSEAEFAGDVATIRAIQQRFQPAGRESERASLRALLVFLTYIWRPSKGRRTSGWRAAGERARHELEQLEIRRYGDLAVAAYEVDPGGIHEGRVLDIYVDPPGQGRKRRGRTPDDDDPEFDEEVEPEISLFLGTGNPVTAFYASKSALQHIERANAMLPWPAWRLSRPALAAVLAEVRLVSGEPAVKLYARLILGLSLMSGRGIKETADTLIVELEHDAQHARMAVTRSDHTLHVSAGHPELLAKSFVPDPLPTYCTRWTGKLDLPLPPAWWNLVDLLVGESENLGQGAIPLARQLIAQLPEALAVSERGIAGALRLELLAAGRGDLALVKAVTDLAGMNAQNLIHYASYERRKVEALWRQVVEHWLGVSLPMRPSHDGDARVGSIHGIDTAKVAKHVADLKRLFHAAVRECRWDAAFDDLTVYVSLWFGLATAGRITTQPVPGVITADGWALVRDKHRPDESTDRYVPLGLGLRRQLDVLRAFTEALGLVNPDFRAGVPGAAHLLEPRVFHRRTRRGTTGYRPKYVDANDAVRKLPGNWGRKLVRSSSDGLPGRFKDAGLGHWVRGRHPWTLTSTFPAREFKAQWLAMQERLERELGFEVLELAGLGDALSPVYPFPVNGSGLRLARQVRLSQAELASRAAEEDRRRRQLVQAQLAEQDRLEAQRDALVEEWFDCCPGYLSAAVLHHEAPVPEAAMTLARSAVRFAVSQDHQLVAAAEAVCAYIRSHTEIPLFATRPRQRFQHNWMVSDAEFRDLAHVEQQLLHAIEQDFMCLPKRGAGEPGRRVEVGRLIAALALRGGLASMAHIDACLKALWQRRPVEALGEARLIELGVHYPHTQEPMHRTVLLEPWLATLITLERATLQAYLDPVFSEPQDAEAASTPNGAKHPKQGSGLRVRAKRWERDFRTYLRAINVPSRASLRAFLAAVRQRIQLDGSPVLAAYASGDLLTHDLPVDEFRRLGGYARLPRSGPGHSHAASLLEQDDIHRMEPGSDLAGPTGGFAGRISTCIARAASECHHRISAVCMDAENTTEWLLCGFADWLVSDHERRLGAKIKARPRRRIRACLRVVWAGLVGFANGAEEWGVIDESALAALFDLTTDYAPARVHHGAWYAFRAFLADKDADHAGVAVGALGATSGDMVSAKILSSVELDGVEALVRSVRSGIGTAALRDVAGRHFALTRATGARRSETEQLRWADVDGDVLRIQPYDEHTLKTVASKRVVPIGLLGAPLWDRLSALRSTGAKNVIDAVVRSSPSGGNFFAAVSSAMKRVAGDDSVGPHHLRHTWASMMTLRMLANTLDLKLLARDLPWIGASLPSDAAASVLLGPEGQCGQGLKAISALLGHQHETTTLKHYVHTLCIALYAYQLAKPGIPIRKAFERRVLSRATSYRRLAEAKRASPKEEDHACRLRDDLEAYADRVRREAGNTGDPWVRHARKGHNHASAGYAVATDWRRKAQHALLAFESLQGYFKTGKGEPPAGAARAKANLQWIAAIPSGKRGSPLRRHPMPEQGVDGTPLPAALLANVAESNAERLLAWLLRLEAEQPDDYRWLMDKWLKASDAREGSMKLGDETDIARAARLSPDEGIEIDVREVAVSNRRRRPGQGVRHRMRIRFGRTSQRRAHVAAKDQPKVRPNRDWRAAGAIRWVMTWVAATDDTTVGSGPAVLGA